MNALLLAVDVPPISHVTIWGSGPLGINRTVAVYIFATVATILLFWLGTRKKDALVPSGILQNTAESGIGFVRSQIIMATMGTDGLGYLPYLSALFFFIFFSNITEIIPTVQFPANARLGMPLVLSLFTWAIYMVVGIVKQGPGHFLKNSTIPSGVPWWVLPLVVPIELLQVLIVRPFSLMVRLFANMLAGHLILVTFASLTAALWALKVTIIIAPFSFALLVAMTGFEILVSFLQAFIFTILTAVYIDSSMHPAH
jgi:F-type H+-transporting ATPase subunit a